MAESAPPEPNTDAKAPDEETIKAIAERLSFFFSDANVRQDLFVRKQLLDEKSDYPRQLTLECLLRFNTIKKISEEESVLLAAAKSLDTLKVAEDGKAIGRVAPFTEALMNKNIPCSLYLTDLPLDDDKKRYGCELDDIRTLFTQYGDVVLTKFRFFKGGEEDDADFDNTRPQKKQKLRTPMGAAFIEFTTEEDCEKAIAETLTFKDGETVEPLRKLQLGGKDLKVQKLADFIESRKKNKKKRKGDEDGKEEKENESKFEPFTFDWKPGCVIQVKGLPEDCDREAMFEAVGKGLGIDESDVRENKIYMDYSRGQTDGAIRFSEPCDDVTQLCKKFADGELELAGKKVEAATILEGEEESKYWTNFIDFKNKQMKERHGKRKSYGGSKKKRRY